MYVCCVYPAISKSPKQLPNCLKITQTSVILIVFNCVTCDVGTCTVTVSVALHESGTRNALLGTRLNNTEVYLTPLLVLEITQLQDKYLYYIQPVVKRTGF